MDKLKLMANKLRIHAIESTTNAGSGHPTSSMSCAEIVSCLFFKQMKKNDEFILSKGHASPILWAAYAEAGLIKKGQLNTLRRINSDIQGHPMPPLVKVATGSLGQGLSAGVGMALAKRLKKNNGKIYVLLGDGEMAEGSVWEAANAASINNLNNICAIVDVNRLGQTGETMHAHDLSIYKRKFSAFGWATVVINGHSVNDILAALNRADKFKRPTAIIAKTLKGKGFEEVENKNGFHGKVLSKEQAEKAIAKLNVKDVSLKSEYKLINYNVKVKTGKINKYNIGHAVATRNAFGNALLNLGKVNKSVVAIDGDVKNSTMTEAFFNAFPKRGFESYIAEQNMVGMAIGMSKQGLTPFVATFAAFLTRAHDFIRMADYSKANIKFVGSHVGVSIGEDGPSQMGLEDLPMFTVIPNSLVLYPCDAVSTEKLTNQMMKHNGISYLRTTREKTPIIYKNNEKFPIGKFKVLKQSRKDKALVIASGITVFEALKAAEKKPIRVIDLYCIKPLDEKGLQKHAKECNNNVIVVEDHYESGIGPLVAKAVGKIKHLYIKSTPMSGKPEQLRRRFKIDADAILEVV